jgi:hypothetical protein
MILKNIFKIFICCIIIIKICISCQIGKEICTCNYLYSAIAMECSQKSDNTKIIDLAEIRHDYYFKERNIVLTIMNKNKIKIICSQKLMLQF